MEHYYDNYHPILNEIGDIDDEEENTVRFLKILFIFIIFGVALVAGVLPSKVKSCGKNKKFMSMANAFSGGLFLAIALVHVLPEVTD
jgi:solute carrier family 39 (zinc transporter), member 1/2/3